MLDTFSAPIRFHHSVRVRVLAATLLVALTGLGFTALNLTQILGERRDARALEVASDALALLSRATTELSLERSASQVALELPGAVAPAIRQLIDDQRRKADAGLDEALERAGGLSATSRATEFTIAIRGLRERLAPLRADLDQQAAVPLASRRPGQVEALPRELKATVAAFQAERHLLRGPGFSLPTEIVLLEAMRDQAWQVREYGGRERTYLAIAVATGSPIPPERLAEMSALSRRVDDAWADIQRLAAHPGLAESIQESVRGLGEGYFGRYGVLRQSVLRAARQDRPAYPLDFASFFGQSTEALAGAEQLAAAASAAIDGFWTERAGASVMAIIADAVGELLLIVFAIGSGVVTILAFRRLDAVRRSMQSLATGDTDAPMPDASCPDEVGAMARALLVFRDTARARTALEGEEAKGRAERDRRQSAIERHSLDFTESLAGVMRALSASAGRVDAASVSMAEVAGRTGDLARATTASAETSAQDLNTVAAATEELTASLAEISRQVDGAAATARGMAGRADGTERVMAGLSQSAERVGDVARLIGDIAGQTNLLALNATIEAARAGEAGKGFAVVASEVKSLAGRTSSATQEIAAQIGAIQSTTRDAVEAVREMAGEVRRMEEIAAAIAAAVEQQGAGVREIAASISSVSQATEAAVSAMGQASVAAEEARATSAEVRGAASGIGEEAATLGREVEQFLAEMQAVGSERRRFDRIPGLDRPVRIDLPGGTTLAGWLLDLSRGGAGVRLERPGAASLPAGSGIDLAIPGCAEALPMRVVRIENGLLGLVARQEVGVAARLERAMLVLQAGKQAA